MPAGTVSVDRAFNYTTVHPTGRSCARIAVKQATVPPWHAKLRLGSFRVVDQMLTVALSARAEEESRRGGGGATPPQLTIDVVDGSGWLGHWMRFNLSASEWRRVVANVLVLYIPS